MANQKRSKNRRSQIIKAAEKVFARKGFAEATISDVAREAGLSDATIYEYFPSKEDLLFSIPGDTTQQGNEILSFHLNYVRGAANKLRSIIYHYLWFYENNEDYASVVMLVLKTNRKFVDTEGYQAVREGYRLIVDIVREGMASGEFRADLDPYLVRAVLLGTIEHQVIRRTLLGRPAKLVDLVDPLTDMVIGGIKKAPESQAINLRLVVEPATGEIKIED